MSTTQTTSRDGTMIAYSSVGDGPPLVLVSSALADRRDHRRLARALQGSFTVVSYDRRGRGESGDTLPYAVEREIEDLQALVDTVGGSAYAFGSSSGAVLVARAAAAGVRIERMALYEPPFRVEAGSETQDLRTRVDQLLGSGRPSRAVSLFMREEMGLPGAALIAMRLVPRLWSTMTAMAHTIPYDLDVMGSTLAGRRLDPEEWREAAAVPALVLYGGKTSPRLRSAAEALHDVLPGSQIRRLDRLNHSAPVARPGALAPVLVEWFQV